MIWLRVSAIFHVLKVISCDMLLITEILIWLKLLSLYSSYMYHRRNQHLQRVSRLTWTWDLMTQQGPLYSFTTFIYCYFSVRCKMVIWLTHFMLHKTKERTEFQGRRKEKYKRLVLLDSWSAKSFSQKKKEALWKHCKSVLKHFEFSAIILLFS